MSSESLGTFHRLTCKGPRNTLRYLFMFLLQQEIQQGVLQGLPGGLGTHLVNLPKDGSTVALIMGPVLFSLL